MPLSLLNHSALALFAQRTRIPTSARSIGFCAIWVCISSSSTKTCQALKSCAGSTLTSRVSTKPGYTKRSNMKKNTFKVWKQTFSELDFVTLRVKSAALGNSLNARHHRPAGRNKPYSLVEDFETRSLTTFFFCTYRLFLLH